MMTPSKRQSRSMADEHSSDLSSVLPFVRRKRHHDAAAVVDVVSHNNDTTPVRTVDSGNTSNSKTDITKENQIKTETTNLFDISYQDDNDLMTTTIFVINKELTLKQSLSSDQSINITINATNATIDYVHKSNLNTTSTNYNANDDDYLNKISDTYNSSLSRFRSGVYHPKEPCIIVNKNNTMNSLRPEQPMYEDGILLNDDPSELYRELRFSETQVPSFNNTLESSVNVSLGGQVNDTKKHHQQTSSSSSSSRLGRFLLWVIVLGIVGYGLYRIYIWYRTKKENERQAYRMAQADRVLGDMQMVPTSDTDENELL